MSDNICIPKFYFIIIFIIFSIFTYFHSMRMTNFLSSQKDKKITKIIIKKKKLRKSESPDDIISNEDEDIKKISYDDNDLLFQRDKEVVNNKFKAPERRLPRHSYPTKYVKKLINIPTRGHPDNYQNIGMLVRKSDEKILKLFGRQRFPRSNQWEYYVINSETFDSISKIPLKIPGNKELSNNDVISLPWLDQSKGKFDVKIFDYDVPRYNPYDY